jgi:hypothetical protein
MSQTPSIAVVVQHHVADYAAWKTLFDADAERRASAGILGTHINRSVEDENLLSVYLAAKDEASLKSFLDSPELKAKMQEAGVDRPPVMKMVEPQEDKALREPSLPGVIVTHEVEDYAKWKAAFDEHQGNRDGHGIVGHAVNRSVDNPNLVMVYLQARTPEEIKSFLEDPALKQAMGKAGVVGAPQFNLVMGGEWGQA